MTILLWAALGLVSIVGLLFLAGRRRVVHRNVPFARLRHFAWSLLFQMAPGGFFIAERRAGPGFLQLALRDVRGETYAVEFGLPDIDWSTNAFDSLQLTLADNGFEPTVETGTGEVSRFMRVVIEGLEPEVIDRTMELFSLTIGRLHWANDSTFDVHFGGPLDVGRVLGFLAKAKRRGA